MPSQYRPLNTTTTDALIEDMLCGEGVPVCDEWDRLKEHAYKLEHALTAMLTQFKYTSINDGDDEAIALAKEALGE